ncbi:GIY-YIG nuclease family protein [Beggiatoa leptomitoformis]|uniref:GIY-YIG nuclease family protein n=1 Tax=Beggiatoa leptomitoformis TaxID=288004 RepID=A0A2N9YJG2_9GAMM|nr:GIY-YIG nuclease family protein [Beggiatoa leptomitoformis]AUI70657.2 GIY-YIG nuclease family protein [Beggiatoa leptomitoformis]QGX03668.1 GIY-YIG nuclease family protein [Beggiatoa leptomitoformis]
MQFIKDILLAFLAMCLLFFGLGALVSGMGSKNYVLAFFGGFLLFCCLLIFVNNFSGQKDKYKPPSPQPDSKQNEIEELRAKLDKFTKSYQEIRPFFLNLANAYIQEVVNKAVNKLTVNNYLVQKAKLEKQLNAMHQYGVTVGHANVDKYLLVLKNEYERLLEKEAQRQEQARIREKIREEQRIERERQQELERIEREQKLLEKALMEARLSHSADVARLEQQLMELEAKSQRAQSMAELTKAGYVYIISNVGSFGEGVYKVGMTRRLEPMDRVKELSSASVPFSFDVHAMISSENAPALEHALHKALNHCRVNKVNVRKEFFRVPLETILNAVEQHHGKIEYVATAEALEFYQSADVKNEDMDYVYSKTEHEVSEDE